MVPFPSPFKHNKTQYRKEGGIKSLKEGGVKSLKEGEGEVKECYNQGFWCKMTDQKYNLKGNNCKQTLWSSSSRFIAEQSHWNVGLFEGSSSQHSFIIEYLK